MKLRSYLLLANTISIMFIIILLLVFFRYMLLSKEQFIWLTLATVSAGLVSGLLHFLLVRPLEAAVRRVGEGAGRIASGDLEARVEHTGLKEFKLLAEQFNHMGSSLQKSFAQVKAAEYAQRELIANMAHDLRTPLASVQSYVEAIEDDVIQDEETFKRYLGTIRSETIRLGELIQDLFELSTLNAEKREPGELRLATVTVEDILVELLPRFTKPFEAKLLQLRVKLPHRPLLLTIQPRHLQRVLQNLLENAVRHSPRGGWIIIEAEEMNGHTEKFIRFTVSDEGEGVLEEERERIFERFYRSDRSRSRESGGAGLGLSIAKLLVEQYGGKIGVQQSSPQGSTFWFTVHEAAEGGEDTVNRKKSRRGVT
ncbi:two-component system sensor histidine kinase SaeS [Paenibacillus endophyticus]|uniref:histidine kinase n=1 Tax=Paenibacillus endophyticus TaxID=1294268 RepID=A0A7W5CB81_9BACL|nr:HAMP domain-containing sensor histidine kinase [Paenibacillus endophyticus]MBB3154080.1 two-component system sensor histidine kinase SaeS [Paenibacillus endophyticus]